MTEPHARPDLPIAERAARVELALAQADRAEDRRRIIAEAIEAAVEEAERKRMAFYVEHEIASRVHG